MAIAYAFRILTNINELRLPYTDCKYKIKYRKDEFPVIYIKINNNIEKRALTIIDEEKGIYGVSDFILEANIRGCMTPDRSVEPLKSELLSQG